MPRTVQPFPMESRGRENTLSATSVGRTGRRPLAFVGTLIGRSLFPLAALVIILGTPWWGAWTTLVLAIVCWSLVMRLV